MTLQTKSVIPRESAGSNPTILDPALSRGMTAQIYPWQQIQWQQILISHQQKRLPHALLLSGQQGLGKKDFALALAHLIFCDQGSKLQTACGLCRGCQLFVSGNHPDFFMLSPEENSKVIKIDQIRDLIASLSQTAQRNAYQIAVIYPAEMMNTAAANALLKTLEEPPGKVLLILVSHQANRLPVTILSRCQKLGFTADGSFSTVNWLAKQIAYEENAAARLLKMAYYAPLRAVELARENYLSLRDRLLQHLLAIYQQQENPIKMVDEFLKMNLHVLLPIFLTIVMDLLRLRLGDSEAQMVNNDQLASLKYLGQVVTQQTLLELMEQLQLAWKMVQTAVPVNLNLLVEGLFLTYAG